CSAARSGSAINYELRMTAESSAGYAYITVPPSSLDNYISKTLDISSATFIGMSVYDETTSGNHEISIYLYDRSGSETHIEGCVSSVRTTAKKWTTIEIPLANYEIIDLRNIEFIVPFVQGVNDQDVFHFDNIFIRN
ncbi:hypothetical protein KAR34_13285, partial [bacterium]|nr:hypothetical protein [bacterium]